MAAGDMAGLVREHADPYRVEPLRSCEHRAGELAPPANADWEVIPAPYPGYVMALYALMALLALVSALVSPILVYAGGFIILAEAFVSAGLLIYTTLGVLLSWLIVRAFHWLWRPALVQTA